MSSAAHINVIWLSEVDGLSSLATVTT